MDAAHSHRASGHHSPDPCRDSRPRHPDSHPAARRPASRKAARRPPEARARGHGNPVDPGSVNTSDDHVRRPVDPATLSGAALRAPMGRSSLTPLVLAARAALSASMIPGGTSQNPATHAPALKIRVQDETYQINTVTEDKSTPCYNNQTKMPGRRPMGVQRHCTYLN